MKPVPEGYEALDFVGFTDRGVYDPDENYVKNDLVHKENTVWKCLADGTTGVTPTEGESWTVFMDSSESFYGAYDNFPRPGDVGRFYIDDTVDPRLMYTWSEEAQDYVLTGGAGGADGGSVDIPITLPSTGWTGTAAPYSQTLTVSQMREGMTPLYMLDTSALTAANADYLQYAYSLITGYTAGYAEITFYAADLPDRDIPVILKGIPAQKFETADNTIIFPVEPSAFALNPDADNRYQATITVEGMTAGDGGIWDIVRSGAVLSLEESKIAANITDVDRLDGAVRITCLEVPEQRYMMKISGVDVNAESGSIILSGMQEWFDRVEEAEDNIDGIVNPINININPIMPNINITTFTANDLLEKINYIQKTTPEPLTTVITIGSLSAYVTHKIDNSNLFRLKPNSYVGASALYYLNGSEKNEFAGSITIEFLYDGVNSYIGLPFNASYDNNVYTGITVLCIEPVFINRQSTN